MAKMEINKDIISIGNKVIPTRNVSQASLWEDGEAKRKRGNQIVFGVIVMAAAYFVRDMREFPQAPAVVVVIGAVIAVFALLRKSKYELHLATNGGNLSLLTSTDHAFMLRLLHAITEAISGQASATQYNVNVDAKTITEAPRVTVSNNQGPVAVGLDGPVTQTVNHSGVALNHIAELMQILNGLPGASEARVTLSEVRSLVASGQRQDQAPAAWSKFIPQLGTVTGLTDNVWNLVAKIGAAIHA